MSKIKFIYKGENILNIPNILSFYRLCAFPIIIFLVFTKREDLFVIFIAISLVSDVLDGFIARNFNMQTKFGATLDNVADIGMLISGLCGLFMFKWTEVSPHIWLLYLFLFIFILSYIIAFIRFKKVPGLHLYGPVIAGYLQGIFLFILFVWDFIPWLYYVAIGWGAIAYIEKTIVILLLDDIRSGVKGLYWLRKEKSDK